MLFFLKLCLTNAANHNFKWEKIIQIWQKRGYRFEIVSFDVTFFYNVWKLVFNFLLKMILIGGLRINPYQAK